jgi:3-phosphoshikimate 1-carboxyvinyltransferase
MPGGKVSMRANTSSQFLSGLLLSAPRSLSPLEITLEGTMVSEPYVEMTVRMLREWGYQIEKNNSYWHIPAPQKTQLSQYAIEPDASAASYFWAAAALTGGDITIPGLGFDSLQGDVQFVRALEQMGARINETPNGIRVQGKSLNGIDIDMNSISDTVMTLGVVACFAQGPTTIRNVGHIRHKETDRISALANELGKIGAHVTTNEEGLVITPPCPGQALHGARIHTYDDHRMAMSLSLAGLLIPGIVIEDPGCVRKTYPGFFEDLEKLRKA